MQSFDVDDIRKKVIDGYRPDIPTLDVPVEIQDIIRNGWDSDPNKRPDFVQIEKILKEVLDRTPQRSALEELDLGGPGAGFGGGDALDGLF